MAINVKQILADALISLNDEKPLNKITVTDIIKRAGSVRQTFYNHFKDKYDLIYWIYSRTLVGERYLVETKGYYYYMVRLHEEAEKIKPFLKNACMLTGQNSLTDALYEQNYNYYKNYIIEHYGRARITAEVEYALRFNAAGGSHVYIRWIMGEIPGTPEQQAVLTLACMPQTLKSFLSLYEGTETAKKEDAE